MDTSSYESITPEKPLKVFSITTMFPNPKLPQFGIFVLRRLVAAQEHATIIIVNPIPYFPGATLLARYKHRSGLPNHHAISSECGKSVEVHCPLYVSVPGFCKPLDGFSLYLALRPLIKKLGPFDVIDTQLAYPDGFAGALLSREFGIPFVVTLRGHDINVLPKLPVRGKMVRWVLHRADRVMGVADALRQAAVALGCPETKTETIPNGVDTRIFTLKDRKECLATLRLDPTQRYLLSVGHLIERKGHHLLIESLKVLSEERFQNVSLLIIGGESIEGNYRQIIEDTIINSELSNRVILAGEVPQDQLALWYGAAHCLCLASSMEGWANVLLESLACGRPVVATRVWGTPEVVKEDVQGVLVERTPESIAHGIKKLLSREWEPLTLREYAQQFTWQNSGKRLVDNYNKAAKK
jgi:teichuronic acid biosynthesis glycosyltransferase TuaC